MEVVPLEISDKPAEAGADDEKDAPFGEADNEKAKATA